MKTLPCNKNSVNKDTMIQRMIQQKKKIIGTSITTSSSLHVHMFEKTLDTYDRTLHKVPLTESLSEAARISVK